MKEAQERLTGDAFREKHFQDELWHEWVFWKKSSRERILKNHPEQLNYQKPCFCLHRKEPSLWERAADNWTVEPAAWLADCHLLPLLNIHSFECKERNYLIQNLSHLETNSMSVFESLPISSYCTQAEVKQTGSIFSIVYKLWELPIFKEGILPLSWWYFWTSSWVPAPFLLCSGIPVCTNVCQEWQCAETQPRLEACFPCCC